MTGNEILVGAVLSQPRAVVIEGEDLARRDHSALVDARDAVLILVDVVP
jgi:hypothetical protein